MKDELLGCLLANSPTKYSFSLKYSSNILTCILSTMLSIELKNVSKLLSLPLLIIEGKITLLLS